MNRNGPVSVRLSNLDTVSATKYHRIKRSHWLDLAALRAIPTEGDMPMLEGMCIRATSRLSTREALRKYILYSQLRIVYQIIWFKWHLARRILQAKRFVQIPVVSH